MRLADSAIKQEIDKGNIQFTPAVSEDKITGITVDVTLGNMFRKMQSIDSRVSFNPTARKAVRDKLIDNLFTDAIDGELEYVSIAPGEFVIAHTNESVKLGRDLVGWLDGKSSLARLGLMVHITAHRIDPGWDGQVVLELYNVGQCEIALEPNMEIGAISFERIDGYVETPYDERTTSRYKKQTGAQQSKY